MNAQREQLFQAFVKRNLFNCKEMTVKLVAGNIS